MITHTGGCHCGRVRFEVLAPPRLEVLECNCSISEYPEGHGNFDS
jgi:hypothetical protein